MLVVMELNAAQGDIERVVRQIEKLGLKPHPSAGAERTAIGITGNRGAVDTSSFENLPGVKEVIRVSHAYKLVSGSNTSRPSGCGAMASPFRFR